MKILKTIIAIVFFCLPLSDVLLAQEFNGNALYKIRLAEDKFDFDGKLMFSEKISLFTYKESTKKKWVVDSDDPMGPIQVVHTDAEGYVLWKALGESEMYVREFCAADRPEIYIDTVKIDWILLNEKAKISGLSCQKAITTFRGREYTVWYTSSIPISIGPWKFHGLPGLIVSITDSENEVEIRLIDLNLSAPANDLSNPITQTTTSREDFINCLDIQYEKYYRRNQAIIAQLQAQAQADGDDIEISDGGLSGNRKSTEIK